MRTFVAEGGHAGQASLGGQLEQRFAHLQGGVQPARSQLGLVFIHLGLLALDLGLQRGFFAAVADLQFFAFGFGFGLSGALHLPVELLIAYFPARR
jgi:hypothetical protein